MILLIAFAVGLVIYSVFFLQESGLFRIGRTKKFDAVLIDEVEDEVYDNTGNTYIRFFKAYEYFDGTENCVVRSERPMRRITDKVGRKCVIYVDTKNRKAMEMSDIVLYRVKAVILIALALFLVGLYFYLKNNVKGVSI